MRNRAVTTVKKSQATRSWAWLRMKVYHRGPGLEWDFLFSCTTGEPGLRRQAADRRGDTYHWQQSCLLVEPFGIVLFRSARPAHTLFHLLSSATRIGDSSIDDLCGGMNFYCRKRASPRAFAGAFSEDRRLLPEGDAT